MPHPEKRNTTLWQDDNFVGTELNLGVECAKVAGIDPADMRPQPGARAG